MAQKNTVIKKICSLRTTVLFVFAFLFLIPGIAGAASLYISPSSGSHNIGSTFGINIYVSSNDQIMNAASGVLSFPQDKLEIISISKTGSIMSLWVEEPSFSNILGTATFEGIVLNPGFTGSTGKIISAIFRVKAAGSASIAFATGSVLANDGLGTNILTSLSSAQFTLGTVTPTPTPTPEPTRVGIPSSVEIISSTHPDQGKWYQSNEAKFSWNLPVGINAVRLLVGELARSTPTIVYTPAINSRDLSELNLADGIWYFHVQLRNNAGYGGTSHFKFQIDTTSPERFNIQEATREDATNPRVRFLFEAVDAMSGIDFYRIQIDEENAQDWQDDGTHVYETPVLGPGAHRIFVTVFDKAGNTLANSKEFTVEPLWPPTITQYPSVLKSGAILTIMGNATYENEEVTIFLQRDKEESISYTVMSDEQGAFIFTTNDKLPEGLYNVWAVVTDERGAKSDSSELVTIVVEQQPFLKIGSQATKILAVIVPIVALVILLIGMIWYAWYKFTLWRNSIKEEVKEAEQALHKSVVLLKKDLAEQIRMLKRAKSKRKLTQEEEKIIRKLKKNLDIVEKFVQKEIRDIKRKVG